MLSNRRRDPTILRQRMSSTPRNRRSRRMHPRMSIATTSRNRSFPTNPEGRTPSTMPRRVPVRVRRRTRCYPRVGWNSWIRVRDMCIIATKLPGRRLGIGLKPRTMWHLRMFTKPLPEETKPNKRQERNPTMNSQRRCMDIRMHSMSPMVKKKRSRA